MSQATITMDANQSGTAYTSDLSDALAAVDTKHAGANAPTLDVAAGKFWLDTSSTPVLKIYNSGWKSLFTVSSGNVTMNINTGTFTNLNGTTSSLGTASSGNLTVTGDISVSGDVDGRDLSVDGAKLDGIPSNANAYSPPQAIATTSNVTFNNITSNGTVNTNTIDNVSGTDVDVTANLEVTGAITASGNITAYSDIRLKSDIKTMENALDKIMLMRGCEYTMDGKEAVGVIAQEVEEVVPQLVSYHEKSKLKSVAYGNMVAVLIEGMKEQQAQIEDLKARIKVLEK